MTSTDKAGISAEANDGSNKSVNIEPPFVPDQIPAVYEISNEQYHASIGVSSSGLKLFRQSPLHYWNRYVRPDKTPHRQTPALVQGTQIHTAVLEPGLYFDRYHPLPRKLDRRLKEDKLEYEFHESEAAKGGKSLIDADSHATCQRIAEQVHTNEAAAFLFEQAGIVEKSLYWRDETTGVLCKCRPDKYLTELRVMLDLKSCASAAEAEFQRAVYNFGYHISAQFYKRGIEAVFGQNVDSIIWAAFEKEEPYAAAFYTPDPEMLAAADSEINSILASLAECEKSGEWPGYPEQILPISLPAWAKV